MVQFQLSDVVADSLSILIVNIYQIIKLAKLNESMDVLEELLVKAVNSQDPFLSQVAVHLIHAGGKRLRPILTIASAAASYLSTSLAENDLENISLTSIPKEVLLGGVAVELVHLGSLYHDDVMDEATTRRKVETVNARWGNLVAIVAGDFLLARASGVAADLGAEVSSLLAETIARLCEGQVIELQDTFNLNRTEASYLQAISGKTASLMATACHIGALLSGVSDEKIQHLRSFGESFGMIFQLRDDILDLIGAEEILGKQGQDLIEGIYTLPVIHTLGDPIKGPELQSLITGVLDQPTLEKARSIIIESGGIRFSLETAKMFADKAKQSLYALGDNAGVQSLSALSNYMVESIEISVNELENKK